MTVGERLMLGWLHLPVTLLLRNLNLVRMWAAGLSRFGFS